MPCTTTHRCSARQAGLNRAILDEGWAEFRGTSRRCSRCGYTEACNRPAQALFVCLGCSHTDSAGTNASHNILARGARGLDRQVRCLWCGGRLCQAHKGQVRNRGKAGTRQGDHGCSSRGAVGVFELSPEKDVKFTG